MCRGGRKSRIHDHRQYRDFDGDTVILHHVRDYRRFMWKFSTKEVAVSKISQLFSFQGVGGPYQCHCASTFNDFAYLLTAVRGLSA